MSAIPLSDVGHFDEVMQLHWPRIFKLVLLYVRDKELAEDLTQDCFWNAYKGWKRFRGDCSVNTWLSRIAVNVIRNYVRSQRIQFWCRASYAASKDIADRLPDSRVAPDLNLIMQERVHTIWKAVKVVSPKQRMVFRLRFAEELEIHEIAAAMGITEGAVKVHLFRAVATVRRKLRV